MKIDWSTFWVKIVEATGETITMVCLTLLFASILGITIGLLFFVTRKGNILENKVIFFILNVLVNVIRPIPFIILLVAIGPITRVVVGTTIGTMAAVFPMTIAAAFAIARVVENNLVSIDSGVIEAAQSMGASPIKVIFTILIPEALGPLILGLTFIAVALIDFSAMAGTVGGGGLGAIAMSYGYQRFDTSVIVVTVVILIIMAQGAQLLGNFLSRFFLRR